MNLFESIGYVGKNKHLPNVLAKKLGTAKFSECKELIDNGTLDNDSNRDEELDTINQYTGKINHLIRYVMGISEKGQLMVSVLKDNPSKIGLIRDNGTMFGLAFGKYYDDKVLNGHEWLDLFDSIIEGYGVDFKDSEFITMLTPFINSLSESQLDLKYSWKCLLDNSPKAKEMYDGTEIAYVVNLYTTKQHQKDMINCNKQSNPWVAYNYYMTGLKYTPQYKTQFLGSDLLEYFSDKEGTSKFKVGYLMSGYKTDAEKRKIAKVIPLYMGYCISKYCKNIDELNDAHKMIIKFNNHDDDDVSKYWIGMFTKMVNDTTYQEMVDFYDKYYHKVFISELWNTITESIKSIVTKHCDGSESTAMKDLQIKKFHTGMWFVSVALWFRENNQKKSLKIIIEQIVNNYVKLLNGNVDSDGTAVPVYSYFGTKASIYKSTSGNQRMEKLFQYVTKEVESWLTNRTKDRDVESKFRESAINKLSVFCTENEFIPKLKVLPLSTDVLTEINLSNGDGLHWLHKTPHTKGGDAKDGFLGMIDDNLSSSTKFKNWDCTPNEYWKMVIDKNEKMLDNVEGTMKRKVQRSIDTLYEMVEIDLTA
jgi:hypothetical protein